MKRFLVLIFLLISVSSFAQTDYELWVKNSPEIRLNFKDAPFEIRWRPVDQMIMPDHYFGKHSLVRTDLMLGVNVWKFKIFNYTKFDEFKRLWTGIRLDLNLDFFNKKLMINIQERYFWGLNTSSKNHYYLVQYPRYAVTDKVHLGALCYGKWDTDEQFNEGEWFMGPSFYYVFPYNFSLHLALTTNIFNTKQNMLFVRLGYKIKL